MIVGTRIFVTIYYKKLVGKRAAIQRKLCDSQAPWHLAYTISRIRSVSIRLIMGIIYSIDYITYN